MGPRAGRQRQGPDAGRKRHRGALRGNPGAMLILPVLAILDPAPAWAADAGGASDFVLMAIVFAAGALALAGGLWGLSEYQNNLALRRTLRLATAKARVLLSARDAWLSAGREALLVWSTDNSESFSFGNGAQLMEACLRGPDARPSPAGRGLLPGHATPLPLT